MSDRPVRLFPEGQPRPASASAATGPTLTSSPTGQLSDPVGPYMATSETVLRAHAENLAGRRPPTVDLRRHHRDPEGIIVRGLGL
jgi:hypothetical protein